MKLVFPSVNCWHEGRDISVEVEINDNNLYKFECSHGHPQHEFIRNEKFEILFDLGILALQNSFQRESVSSFASALERFYEFAIQVIFLEENKMSLKDFDDYWKIVKTSSERQLGAFYYLFLHKFNETPRLPKNKSVSFRNNVIHKGEIPSKEKVIEYIKDVYGCIMSNLVALKKKYPNGFENLHLKKKERIELEVKEKLCSSRFGTFIDKENESDILEKQLEIEREVEKEIDMWESYWIYIK